jgi:VIT1/CCC1 family predicted Fe2+/Mn2+ transporter
MATRRPAPSLFSIVCLVGFTLFIVGFVIGHLTR